MIEREYLVEYLIVSGYENQIIMDSVRIKLEHPSPRYLVVYYITKYDHRTAHQYREMSMAIPTESLIQYTRDSKITKLLG